MRSYLTCFLLSLTMLTSAQGFVNQSAEQAEKAEQLGFTSAKKAPTYKGGREAMSKYIYSNLIYPEDAKAQRLEGDVELVFFVDTDGTVSDITVKKGVSKSIDAEAVRLVEGMKDWIPGKNGVYNVIMKTSLIIGFHLAQ